MVLCAVWCIVLQRRRVVGETSEIKADLDRRIEAALRDGVIALAGLSEYITGRDLKTLIGVGGDKGKRITCNWLANSFTRVLHHSTTASHGRICGVKRVFGVVEWSAPPAVPVAAAAAIGPATAETYINIPPAAGPAPVGHSPSPSPPPYSM